MSAESGYIPGKPWEGEVPLARYLPRLEKGTASKWLQGRAAGDGILIDPFGSSPSLALEAALSGRKILVAANNPIAKFLIEVSASAPSNADLRAALAELAAARRGSERLEPHILSLYETDCDNCGERVTAEAFLWQSDELTPYARIYTCPHCENQGEFPTTQADQQEAAKFTSNGLHRARALERIAPMGSPHRKHAEDALDVYPPRAMYALSTLVNKLDGLALEADQRKLLEALMLYALDQSNAMWHHPRGRSRPKQLSIPTKFRERNVWHSLERGVAVWESSISPIEVTEWPNFPEGASGICLYEGRARDLSGALDALDIGAVLTALPRPNQAFWTLSALWSGWLWGHEALGAFESVLGRRRYDWAWHTNALQSALNALKEGLGKNVPIFGLVTESEARFDAAVTIAANQAGLRIEQLDMRPQEGQSQYSWSIDGKKEKTLAGRDLSSIVQEAAGEMLEDFGQPSELSRLQAAALLRFERQGLISSLGKSAGEIYSEFTSLMELALSMGGKFKRYGGGEGDLEGGLWWLADAQGASEPLADRIEVAVVNHLLKNPGTDLEEMEESMCQLFPGRLTPPRGLILKLLHSYGGEDEGRWTLQDSDSPEARRADLEEMEELIAALGKRLEFTVDRSDGIQWQDGAGRTVYCFHVQASALMQPALEHVHESDRAFIALPGGRAELVLYKLKSNPHVQEIVEGKWQFIKFRALRRLAENAAIQRDSIEELLALDPLAEDDPQIPLL